MLTLISTFFCHKVNQQVIVDGKKQDHVTDDIICVSSQLDSTDEQAAQIRRELDGRLQLAEKIARVRSWKVTSFAVC